MAKKFLFIIKRVSEMKNLVFHFRASADKYPVVSPRGGETLAARPDTLRSRALWEGLILFPFVVIVGLFVFGYSRTTPALQNENQPRPQIEITPLVFDFGEISFGAVAKQNFKIKNIGKEILEIKRVATSCSCTTAKVSQEKINPGEEAELSVVYDTAAMGSGSHGKGAQERIIYVKSNDPINPQVEITISAYVR